MKVKELVKQLSKMPEDAHIVLYDDRDEGDVFLKKVYSTKVIDYNEYNQAMSVLALSDHISFNDTVVVLKGTGRDIEED